MARTAQISKIITISYIISYIITLSQVLLWGDQKPLAVFTMLTKPRIGLQIAAFSATTSVRQNNNLASSSVGVEEM